MPDVPVDNKILRKMLDRLFASLVNGPSLNCKPHSSRQRVDLTHLSRLRDASPEAILRTLLGDDRSAKVMAKVPAPRGKAAAKFNEPEVDDAELTPDQRAARTAFREQQAVLGKFRTIAEEAKTYENDTGVHVLQIGFPLLSLPPGGGAAAGSVTRRVLAPLAFISLTVNVKSGAQPSIAMECRNDGADLVVPNVALLAWLEQQTGEAVADVESDEAGENPWREIRAIAQAVCDRLRIELPAALAAEQMPDDFTLVAAPKADDDEHEPNARVLPAAVVGLYPMTNQGLLRDMQSLVAGEQVAAGPIENFLKVGVSLDAPKPSDEAEAPVVKQTRDFASERLITVADPCQARAVRQSRTSRGLVIHGPPGTGKSQTIANIIGDHLARGERVLFVCEKRTALDVVMNRLEAMGVGQLCGVVHDPQRDQRELYKSIREQLDTLPDAQSDASADGKLQRLDSELQELHGELTTYHKSLMVRPDANTPSFHELVGRWLDVAPTVGPATLGDDVTTGIDRRAVETNVQAIADTLDRAQTIGANNPWAHVAGVALDVYLTTPIDQFRRATDDAAKVAQAVDATIDPAIPPLPATCELAKVATARAQLAGEIEAIRNDVAADVRTRWASAKPADADAGRQRLDATNANGIASTPIDAELATLVTAAPPTPQQIAEQTSILEAYAQSASGLLGFLAFGHKKNAAGVLQKYGLQVTPANATRVVGFLGALKARLALRDAIERAAPGTFVGPAIPEDAKLVDAWKQNTATLAFLKRLTADANLADVHAAATAAIAQPDAPTEFLRGLRATGPRVEAIAAMAKSLSHQLWSDAGRTSFDAEARAGRPIAPLAASLVERFGTLENVLRVRDGLAALPANLRPAIDSLVTQAATSADGLGLLRRAADANEIQRRLLADKQLTSVDGQRLSSSFARYKRLDSLRKELTIASIQHRWTSKQRDRLLANGGRLNTTGADLRRRLLLSGQRAMRLRQVIQVGQHIEGGDPLFDVRPVWMASPETVAQIFPRRAMFDVIIFDEASQCRLEEALPVLLRANRVVIAGDPKQLPPTRFFEGAVAVSEDEEAENEQQLFEQQQGEIEDLLGAALNIEIDEAYLDVHYRSKNSDLIEFSNQYFYSSRLQAIPSHPAQRSAVPPIAMHHVGGVYEKRSNEIEAKKVVEIVSELLAKPEPPSIGIACFNVSQRDLILELLEEKAAEDATFGKAFAIARERQGKGSFEGLFVKNLENVQGDERDHLIISTTYGPDAKGRFYRRFGPVGMAGGGRRLNVLVTRARAAVHLITSIPQNVYRALPPVPTGETPGGAWLLFAYLNYAEKLADEYATTQRVIDQATPADAPTAIVRPVKNPSLFAKRFAERLRDRHQVSSDVHWGNDGFCVDVALHHPTKPEAVTVGVECDLTRFANAADPVEWEVFRTGILEANGWQLSRVWSPHYFRDAQAAERRVLDDARIAAG